MSNILLLHVVVVLIFLLSLERRTSPCACLIAFHVALDKPDARHFLHRLFGHLFFQKLLYLLTWLFGALNPLSFVHFLGVSKALVDASLFALFRLASSHLRRRLVAFAPRGICLRIHQHHTSNGIKISQTRIPGIASTHKPSLTLVIIVSI